MDPDVANFGLVCAIIIVSVGSMTAIGIKAWRAIRETRERPVALPQQDTARLEQIQQSIEAMAVEVERIAEAQRFSARLMSERSEQPSLPR